jgi:hypothetical protein
MQAIIRTLHSDGIGPMPRVFAYCRVSTVDQTTENQRLEIKAAGFAIEARRLIEESISGSVAAKERPGFIKLIERMESGDVLVVTKLDRLGRNAMDVRASTPRRKSSRTACNPVGPAWQSQSQPFSPSPGARSCARPCQPSNCLDPGAALDSFARLGKPCPADPPGTVREFRRERRE